MNANARGAAIPTCKMDWKCTSRWQMARVALEKEVNYVRIFFMFVPYLVPDVSMLEQSRYPGGLSEMLEKLQPYVDNSHG